MERWRGKLAVVTGASSGIGAAIVERFVHEGLKVIGLARRYEMMYQNLPRYRDLPGKFHPFKTDLTKPEDVDKALLWIANAHGPIHILIHNAGAYVPGGLINGDLGAMLNQISSMLTAPMRINQAAVQSMLKNNVDGCVVHINSIYGHKVTETFGPNGMYPVLKHAMTAMVETLGLELSGMDSKIRVSSVSPGMTKTDLINIDEMSSVLPNLPILNVESVVDAVIYILSVPPDVQIRELTIKPTGERD